MCMPLPEVYHFGKRVNEHILKGEINNIPILIKSFETKGYKITYEVANSLGYGYNGRCKNIKIKGYDWSDDFLTQSAQTNSNRDYMGTLIFTPSIVRDNLARTLSSKRHALGQIYCHIAEKTLQVHNDKCILSHYYNNNSHANPVSDPNVYVMCVYSEGKGENGRPV